MHLTVFSEHQDVGKANQAFWLHLEACTFLPEGKVRLHQAAEENGRLSAQTDIVEQVSEDCSYHKAPHQVGE